MGVNRKLQRLVVRLDKIQNRTNRSWVYRVLGTGQVKRDSYNGEAEWVVGNEVSKM
jgi:hypothetical protein